MSALNAISADKLFRLIGAPACPAIIDLREGEQFLIPSSRPFAAAERIDAEQAVVVCADGAQASPGIAAWLRSEGIGAEILEGGVKAWKAAGLPLVDGSKLPPRDAEGRTRWVTRARPKVDRIACPWLIRRFVDPAAVFLFVAPSEVEAVADQLNGTAFDYEGVFWSHRGDQCSFDTMIDELGLTGFEGLQRLRVIVRGADTGHPEFAPQSAGLVAASLGLSRMFADDLEQLEAGMLIYDAFYRWCRDAVDETHDWVSHARRSRRGK